MFNPCPKPPKKAKKSTKIPPKIVKKVFKRDSNICNYCGILTSGLNTCSCLPSGQIHHIVKRRQADGHKEELLNTVCWRCHSEHGRISAIDKKWLNGDDVYFSGRLLEKIIK